MFGDTGTRRSPGAAGRAARRPAGGCAGGAAKEELREAASHLGHRHRAGGPAGAGRSGLTSGWSGTCTRWSWRGLAEEAAALSDRKFAKAVLGAALNRVVVTASATPPEPGAEVR
ncbi:hypothetical protein QJS66_21010 [Kocuria rhizophila]|nr:hypothetical protein QJS66_21010 [Kocuria rhizophila]